MFTAKPIFSSDVLCRCYFMALVARFGLAAIIKILVARFRSPRLIHIHDVVLSFTFCVWQSSIGEKLLLLLNKMLPIFFNRKERFKIRKRKEKKNNV